MYLYNYVELDIVINLQLVLQVDKLFLSSVLYKWLFLLYIFMMQVILCLFCFDYL